MRFYLVDDDPNVVNILTIILRDRGLGEVCGSAENGLDALEDLPILRPDVVLADLLMPRMDGVTFVRQARVLLPDAAYLMLSQVSSKDMIAAAYEAGVEFFLQKPINAVEVESVVRTVSQGLGMKRAFSQMQSLMGAATVSSPAPGPFSAPGADSVRQRAEDLLRRMGILGEAGSRDILTLVCELAAHPQAADLSLGELCARMGDPPKTVEQRIRRAAYAGLVNLANLGVEDYANELFTEYAGALYSFEQVRREMDCIRGKSVLHGSVQIRSFLSALVSCCTAAT